MTLSDEEIQQLQLGLKSKVRDKPGDIEPYFINGEKRYFQIVNSMNDTTQAIAFVPVDDKKGNNPNYQETTIVVAGTQVPGENFKESGDQSYFLKRIETLLIRLKEHSLLVGRLVYFQEC
ncbi:hypothetical protein [Streptococcus lactarius]|uniref:hypothetical protein n=1 Tax=Streptococcus lactarius TaxID=684066 RepID=UPI00360C5DBC